MSKEDESPAAPRVSYDDGMLDITAPRFGAVVSWSRDVLWVHVDGKCVLRVCRIPTLLRLPHDAEESPV